MQVFIRLEVTPTKALKSMSEEEFLNSKDLTAAIKAKITVSPSPISRAGTRVSKGPAYDKPMESILNSTQRKSPVDVPFNDEINQLKFFRGQLDLQFFVDWKNVCSIHSLPSYL